jgi:hypothetical protein
VRTRTRSSSFRRSAWRHGIRDVGRTVRQLVPLAIAAWIAAVSATSSAEDVSATAVNRIVCPSTPSDVVNARNILFAQATAGRLQHFRNGTHDAVAIYAAWEDMLQTSRTAMAEGRFDVGAAERFLGFVEGRLRLSLPDWWQEALRSAKVDGKRIALYGSPDIMLNAYRRAGIELSSGRSSRLSVFRNGRKVRGESIPEVWELDVASNVTLQRVGASLRLAIGARSITIPTEFFEQEDPASVSLYLDDNQAYLALEAGNGEAFPIVSLDGSGNVLWRARVWSANANGAPQGLKGIYYERISLVGDQDRIIVFGVQTNAMFLEAFDKKTGKSLLRFSTWYYDELR